MEKSNNQMALKQIDLIQHGGFAGTQHLKSIKAEAMTNATANAIEIELANSNFFGDELKAEQSKDLGKDNDLVYEISVHDDHHGFKTMTVADDTRNENMKRLLEFLKQM